MGVRVRARQAADRDHSGKDSGAPAPPSVTVVPNEQIHGLNAPAGTGSVAPVRLALSLAACTLSLLAWAAVARAQDQINDVGAIDPGSLAGGEGWLIWAAHFSDGAFKLRVPGGDITLPRNSRIRTPSIGLAATGRPTAVYSACRPGCRVYRLDLSTRVERRVKLPRLPRGCRYLRPVIDRRLYIIRTGLQGKRVPARCRAGIYRLRRGRLSLVQRGGSIDDYDVSGDRLAFERAAGGARQVLTRRLGGRATVVDSAPTPADTMADFWLAWQGESLWLAVWTATQGGARQHAALRRVTPGRAPSCLQDQLEFDGSAADVPRAWTFTPDDVWYVVGDDPANLELRRRDAPPPRLAPCP